MIRPLSSEMIVQVSNDALIKKYEQEILEINEKIKEAAENGYYCVSINTDYDDTVYKIFEEAGYILSQDFERVEKFLFSGNSFQNQTEIYRKRTHAVLYWSN